VVQVVKWITGALLVLYTLPVFAGSNLSHILFFPPPASLEQLHAKWQTTPGASLEEVELSLRLAEYFALIHSDSALVFAEQALEGAQRFNHERYQAIALFFTGLGYQNVGLFNESLEQLLRALKLFEDQKDLKGMANAANHAGRLSYYLRQEQRATELHEKALDWYKAADLPEGEAQALGALGHLFEKRKDYSKAIELQNQALQLYQKVGNLAGVADIFENIASIEEDRGAYKNALNGFRRALSLNIANGRLLPQITNLNDIGDCFRKLGLHDSAQFYTEQSLRMAHASENLYGVKSAYSDLSKLYLHIGRYEMAYQYLQKANDLNDTLYSQQLAAKVAGISGAYQLERKNRAIEILEKEKELSETYRIFLGSSTILLLLVVGVIVNRQMLKNRQSKRIFEEQERAHKAEQHLLAEQLNLAMLKEKQLQQELELKSKSLNTHTLHILEKNKLLEHLKDKLELVHEVGAAEKNKRIRKLMHLIDQSFVHDQSWQNFQNTFEQVHHTFFQKLKNHTPMLSTSDLRLCALIKLNLTSQDMATILGISSDSLRIARYRLRKRLGLHKADSLTTFIQQF
jgi:tetratricopeptide (TPR) repeat protein